MTWESEVNDLAIKCLSDVVTINFSALSSLMKYGISSNLNCTVIVRMKRQGLLLRQARIGDFFFC